MACRLSLVETECSKGTKESHKGVFLGQNEVMLSNGSILDATLMSDHQRLRIRGLPKLL